MGKRPDVERALKTISSRYELVHAAAKRVEELLQRGEDIFMKDKVTGELTKKTFQAIQDIASGRVKVIRIEQGE
ncbi:MAG: DNA-directed RNA polymerase subunit omega [Aquificaceae bacterium]